MTSIEEKKRFNTSESGFSMVEIMVALGLLGALSLGVMKLMENSNKAAKSIEVKDEISQLQRQISDVLNNPNNCEASFSGKTAGQSVPIIYQVINGVPTPKFSINQNIGNKVQIQGMKVKSVDANGIGSQALATLEISFKKLGGVFGGQDIKKDISMNANLCFKNVITGSSSAAIVSQCSGPGKSLIQGPHDWITPNGTKWGVCQDCSDISSNTIRFCQSQGGGAGIDIGNVSETSCVHLGGTFDENTSRCLFAGLTLEELIQSKINEYSATIPNSIVNTAAPTCNAGASYSLTVVDGKIQLACSGGTPPVVSCTGCSNWGAWSLHSKGWSCEYGCKDSSLEEGTRTTCRYQRACQVKTPAGCTTAIANDVTGFYTYSAGSGGGKWRYKNRGDASNGSCPAASHFGL